MNSQPDAQPSWEPIGGLAAIAGYAAPARIQSNRSSSNSKISFDDLSQAAEELKDDPLRMKQLAERVYQLMLEDLQQQRDRGGWGM